MPPPGPPLAGGGPLFIPKRGSFCGKNNGQTKPPSPIPHKKTTTLLPLPKQEKKRRRLPAPAGAGTKANAFFPRTCAGEKILLSFQVCGPSGPVRAGSCHPHPPKSWSPAKRVQDFLPPSVNPRPPLAAGGLRAGGCISQFLEPSEAGPKILSTCRSPRQSSDPAGQRGPSSSWSERDDTWSRRSR